LVIVIVVMTRLSRVRACDGRARGSRCGRQEIASGRGHFALYFSPRENLPMAQVFTGSR